MQPICAAFRKITNTATTVTEWTSQAIEHIERGANKAYNENVCIIFNGDMIQDDSMPIAATCLHRMHIVHWLRWSRMVGLVGSFVSMLLCFKLEIEVNLSIYRKFILREFNTNQFYWYNLLRFAFISRSSFYHIRITPEYSNYYHD